MKRGTVMLTRPRAGWIARTGRAWHRQLKLQHRLQGRKGRK